MYQGALPSHLGVLRPVPRNLDAFGTTVWYQAHHLDLGFYDRFYPPAAVPEHIRSHLDRWHSFA